MTSMGVSGGSVGRMPAARATPALTRRRPRTRDVLASGWTWWPGRGGSRSSRPSTALPPRLSQCGSHTRAGRSFERLWSVVVLDADLTPYRRARLLFAGGRRRLRHVRSEHHPGATIPERIPRA